MKRARWLLVGALMLLSAGADAADPLGEAKGYYDAGVRAYSSAKYEIAVEAFREAYRLAPRETVLFSLAQAERRQYTVEHDPAMLREAIGHFRKYLQDVPEGGRRADAVEALGELEAIAARLNQDLTAGNGASEGKTKLTRLMISALTSGATISLDGKETTEPTILQVVAPGKHTIMVKAPGYVDEEREVEAIEGALLPVEFSLREKPSFMRIVAPTGALIAVDGEAAGEAPLREELFVSPGVHVVTVTRTGYVPFQASVNVERGALRRVAVSLPRTIQRRVAFGVLATAIVSTLVGVIQTGVAVQAESDAEGILSKSKSQNLSLDELLQYNRTIELRDDLRIGAGVLFGSGVGLALLGTGLYLFDNPAPPAFVPPKSSSLRMSLGLSPAGWGLGIQGSF